MLAKGYMLHKSNLAPTLSHSRTTRAVACSDQRCRSHRPVVKHSSEFEGHHCITGIDTPSREIVFPMEPKCPSHPTYRVSYTTCLCRAAYRDLKLFHLRLREKYSAQKFACYRLGGGPSGKSKMSPRLPATRHEHDCCSAALPGARRDC